MKNILVLAVAALALAVFAVPAQAQQVTVPNVVGMPSDQAVKTLQAAGLKTSVTLEKTTTPTQGGKVSKQNPAAGQKAGKNSVVVLTAYLYVETVKVAVAPPVTKNPATPPLAASLPIPMVNNMPLDKAREIAKKSGYDLTVGSYKDTTNKALDNYVVEQQFSVPKGSKAFSVAVARYKAPVPNVMKMPLEQAKAALAQAGYEALVTEALAQDASSHGRIVSQNYNANPATKKVGVSVGVFGSGKTVNGIPNVVGIQEAQAVETLKRAGFTAKTTYADVSSPEFQGKVFSFTAETPGSKTVIISVGKTTVAPNFIGQTVSQISAWNTKSVNSGDPGRIRIAIQYREVSTPGHVDKILEQKPAPGAPIAKGSEILLTAGKAPPPPSKPMLVPDVFNLSRDEAWKKFDASGCSVETGIKETAWPEQDGKVIWMDVAPKSVCKKDVKVGIKVGKYTPSAIDVRVTPMPAEKRYFMTIKGGTPPFNIDLTYEAVPVAGKKLIEIVPLKGAPGAKVLTSDYRIIPHITTKAKMLITDAKGARHEYELSLKKDAQ